MFLPMLIVAYRAAHISRSSDHKGSVFDSRIFPAKLLNSDPAEQSCAPHSPAAPDVVYYRVYALQRVYWCKLMEDVLAMRQVHNSNSNPN